MIIVIDLKWFLGKTNFKIFLFLNRYGKKHRDSTLWLLKLEKTEWRTHPSLRSPRGGTQQSHGRLNMRGHIADRLWHFYSFRIFQDLPENNKRASGGFFATLTIPLRYYIVILKNVSFLGRRRNFQPSVGTFVRLILFDLKGKCRSEVSVVVCVYLNLY